MTDKIAILADKSAALTDKVSDLTDKWEILTDKPAKPASISEGLQNKNLNQNKEDVSNGKSTL
ncbi:hypothetical protein [Virgibacillus siamensis]|uniref:hypothetical protein n=1 Tax=Virgibacillus siamensis TaxID=480071 RepID=UPI000986E4DE|nr:hypothetical protein [Virgibacillus siamensis]